MSYEPSFKNYISTIAALLRFITSESNSLLLTFLYIVVFLCSSEHVCTVLVKK